MKEITLEELLEAGCHFGHQVIRSNPKARDFVFEARDNIQIIDLAKTKEGLEEAAAYVKELAQRGGFLLVVGTKRQAQQIVEEEVKRVKHAEGNIFYVTKRWVGGILTNTLEISKNIKKLKEITKMLSDSSEKAKYTKKELGLFDKEKHRLETLYSGIEEIKKTPDALFIIDSHMEHLAVKEAIRMRVPAVAIVDTNSDPKIIDYPIPANDDAVGSIKLIVTYIINAWEEGRKKYQEDSEKLRAKSEKEKTAMELKEKSFVAEVKDDKKVAEVKEKKVKTIKTKAKK
ncbi:MAG: 30S ribosomal protein S2 [Candidatus Levybacteria bacterium CG_4_10_14_0_2_um_filter_35_8]|nr:MAG: 30S ribosomal protein S2 [Candidatus Levybacteria bacterium CG_4_10_14_0_2_um_filter_35_8]